MRLAFPLLALAAVVLLVVLYWQVIVAGLAGSLLLSRVLRRSRRGRSRWGRRLEVARRWIETGLIAWAVKRLGPPPKREDLSPGLKPVYPTRGRRSAQLADDEPLPF